MTDYDIVKLYLIRSEKAICETAKKYNAYCTVIANNILNNLFDAEECVNDTYLNTWNSIPPQKPENLCAYLGKITRNLAINRYKHYNTKKRSGNQTWLALEELQECIPDRSLTEETLDKIILTKSIENFLQSQTKEKCNIFLRRYWYLCSVKEIAQDFKISESKVTSILFRMREKLKKHLEKEGIFI